MYGIFENIGDSLLYHGKHNDRVYIMKISEKNFDETIKRAELLAKNNNYSKIFAKVPKRLGRALLNFDYRIEATIENFYEGTEDCLFLGKFISQDRMNEKNKDLIEDILKVCEEKAEVKPSTLSAPYSIKSLAKRDTVEMAEVYSKAFASYPFPIFDPEYLKETMDDNIKYMGIYHEGQLISIASAETYEAYQSAEMTDFATLPQYRNKGLAHILLSELEKVMKVEGYKTLYTIARAVSYGMNITFKKSGYKYSGTLVNNTNISGNIESMNVWSKSI